MKKDILDVYPNKNPDLGDFKCVYFNIGLGLTELKGTGPS